MVFKERTYRPPLLLHNGHLHTIYASKYRQEEAPYYQRKRWITPDQDFLDVDLCQKKQSKIIVLGHGLEGSSRRPYISGMAKLFLQHGYDICAWNCRSCSGEMNQQARLYNHGEIEDIDFVIQKLIKEYGYSQIILAGFSMGGAIIMNWMGTHQHNIPAEVKAGIAISSPCDIKAASRKLESGINRLYRDYFMKKLSAKIKVKAKQFPGWLDVQGIEKIKKWKEFDEKYSAPLGGYRDAEDFYFHCSAKHRIQEIKKPLLLLNALDDPILSENCYPTNLIQQHEQVMALYTRKGGHVAFQQKANQNTLAETYSLQFAEAILSQAPKQFTQQFEKL